MRFGTADLDALARRAPRASLDVKASLDLGRVNWFQITYELSGETSSLFPPGLHPTMPVLVTLQVWRGTQGPFGAFGLAQVRLSCRAGMRIRAFLLNSVIEGEAVRDALGGRFGFVPTPGQVELMTRSDRSEARVSVNGRTVAVAAMLGPQALDPQDLQHVTNVNAAMTADGLKLFQVEPVTHNLSVHRGRPVLDTFDAEFWGLPGRTLKHAVIAAAAETEITLAPIRYVQDPDKLATEGTQKV